MIPCTQCKPPDYYTGDFFACVFFLNKVGALNYLYQKETAFMGMALKWIPVECVRMLCVYYIHVLLMFIAYVTWIILCSALE